MYEEETDSEPEEEISHYALEDKIFEEENKEEQKQPSVKRKNKIFDYLNEDAKRNKQ